MTDLDGQWEQFAIKASGIATTSLGKGESILSFIYNQTTGQLDGYLASYIGDTEIVVEFSQVVQGGDTVTIYVPELTGLLNDQGMQYYLSEGSLSFTLPVCQVGSASLLCSMYAIFALVDPNGDGCTAD